MIYSKISVTGLGYIGLPTAAILASRKVQVLGIDINPATVNIINEGRVHFIEPELDLVVHAVVAEGYLRATTAQEEADAFIIAVPTPFKEGHQPDLGYIQTAVEQIAPVLKKGDLIILESTSPVGTTEQIAVWLSEYRTDLVFPVGGNTILDVNIAYCPERVLPGKILREMVQNDRVIGGLTQKCSERAAALYHMFVEGTCFLTNARTAEMCKLTENSYRDVNIAFANELSMICDELNINVWELMKLANRHPRVNILQPGAGVGGHCIAVDPWFIVSKTPEFADLIKTARQVNDSKPVWVINKIQQALGQYLLEHPNKKLVELTLVCLGLTFKPDIDDLRESPALEIVKHLGEIHSGRLIVVEPHIDSLDNIVEKNIELGSIESIIEADVLICLVNHRVFDPEHLKIPSNCKLIDVSGLFQYAKN